MEQLQMNHNGSALFANNTDQAINKLSFNATKKKMQRRIEAMNVTVQPLFIAVSSTRVHKLNFGQMESDASQR